MADQIALGTKSGCGFESEGSARSAGVDIFSAVRDTIACGARTGLAIADIPPMLSHVHLSVSDMRRAVAFYSAVMDALGYALKFNEPENGWAGWMRPGEPRPLFLIGRPYDGGPPSHGNGNMVALLASDRPAVDHAHATALQHGGTNEGAPGLRPHYVDL